MEFIKLIFVNSLVVLLLLTLAGCATTPFALTDLRLVNEDINDVIVPGIYPTALNKPTNSITVFSIHGMGNTSPCYGDEISQMFGVAKTSSSNVKKAPESKLENPCWQSGAIAMPVCLPRAFNIKSEAFEGSDPLVIGPECETANSSFEPLSGLNTGEDIKPRRMLRLGTLFKYYIPARYRASDGKKFVFTVNHYAYWWHGDANAIQFPFIRRDLSELRTKDRAAVNRWLKRTVLNEGLIDATFYLGSGGRMLRAGTRSALCLMIMDLRGSINGNRIVRDPCSNVVDDRSEYARLRQSQVVLLTQSLGSRILFDALSRFKTDDGLGERRSAALGRKIGDVIIDSGPLVYMSANQLPLLGAAKLTITREGRQKNAISLSTTSEEGTPEVSFFDNLLEEAEVPTMDEQSSGASTVNVEKDLTLSGPQQTKVEPAAVAEKIVSKEAPEMTAKPAGKASIIAFYDPNDLLGYPAGDHFPETERNRIIDVQQRYATPFFFFANPNAAHDKSFTTDRARRVVLCGATQRTGDTRELDMSKECRR